MIKRVPNLGEAWQNYLRTLGANAGFVEGLIYQYLEDPSLVDERWREAFERVATGGLPSQQDRPIPTDRTEEPAHRTPKLEISGRREGGDAHSQIGSGWTALKGAAAKIASNMEASLSIPTATSQRLIPVKLIDENRGLINQYLDLIGAARVSYTHLIGWALVKALRSFPGLNSAYIAEGGVPQKVTYSNVNLGVAVDVERGEGQRVLLVPNVKNVDSMNFREFFQASNEIFTKARTGKAEIEDFQGTTVTLTNPGVVGTVTSLPRLMPGQGVIVATGAIDYPAEYHGMAPETLTTLGISKVMVIGCTYDHRIIQGAESGLFLARIQSLLLGEANFYDQVFADLRIPYHPFRWSPDRNPALLGLGSHREETEKQARVLQLINAYRVRGHLIADLNPLGSEPLYHYELDPTNYGLTIWDLDRRFITGGLSAALGDAPTPTATMREILATLHQTYCGKIGVEYMNIQHPEQKSWLQMQMEPRRNNWPLTLEVRCRILSMLTSAETFERFLHARFVGHKRFSCEGAETIIPILRELLELAAEQNVIEVVIGMAHRARLNVLANIIAKPITQILSECEGNVDPNSIQGTGDVKYHLGASGIYLSQEGKKVIVTVAPNPSHLESVDPVVEGIVRAKQNRHRAKDDGIIMPVLIHGDAAFAGQGIVAETLNLSQLPGYRTDGTIHLIINNQIGFTTEPEEARSTPYSTDVAKMVQAPIFHVNGDDPEAAVRALSVAFGYRQRFKRDVVIDMLCYRRYGHNEADDPSFTQPLLYRKIREHPPVRRLYAEKLVRDGVLAQEELNLVMKEQTAKLETAFEEMKKQVDRFVPVEMGAVRPEEPESPSSLTPTGVSRDLLAQIIAALTTFPGNFRIHHKLTEFIERRRRAGDGEGPIDWAFAEVLAFGTLLIEGTPVRLSGQDSSRGTFSQRHLVLYDEDEGNEYTPLKHLTPSQASFEVYDSLLSEEALLGFEFGFSVADPLTLVLWEAQFGDFANNAQVIIDQFIVGAEVKWSQPCSLVLLLPHGYEGQGPEHSSAKMERYLQLCAENNLQVCNCTTAAQYFHLLRRQMRGGKDGRGIRKPLVIFAPKSLLRHPRVLSNLAELAEGHFHELVNQTESTPRESVSKVIFCAGKICYELEEICREKQAQNVAILKLEQLYPFPKNQIQKELKKYQNAEEYVWVQEEPRNMGAWTFVKDRMASVTKTPLPLQYVGRPESASTATGSLKVHLKEQAAILRAAISGPAMKVRP
ncbi:MAG TPA: multifunctional oxoglutarate decarboxylase/oxoglutarate dehydrogenase thiamine pyrophosphate-binding subunit/dihydrolipoyllysine-residue succinyltransferase subunit [Terriglobia bacterium]|nr:multifunctional oxoglutarate decarboxylase/oxoglutarate dehydrogenase thiamine pyrophosphate-binding subunit/dihydrolipoyllysine-residue succinyltransferase subunit [Terriglobia bacterium]